MTPEEIHALGCSLVESAEQAGITLRLLGGVAVYDRCRAETVHPALQRGYGDLDFVVSRRGAERLDAVVTGLGFTPYHSFNQLNGALRRIYYGPTKVDVFVGVFSQCHELSLEGRLHLTSPTIPLADLLLTKLQVVSLTRKDAQDLIALLLAHPLTEGDAGGIDISRIGRVCSSDWGWYTTVNDTLEALLPLAGEMVDQPRHLIIREKIGTLKDRLVREPKTLAWRTRALIGRRLPWAQMPEEVRDPGKPVDES